MGTAAGAGGGPVAGCLSSRRRPSARVSCLSRGVVGHRVPVVPGGAGYGVTPRRTGPPCARCAGRRGLWVTPRRTGPPCARCARRRGLWRTAGAIARVVPGCAGYGVTPRRTGPRCARCAGLRGLWRTAGAIARVFPGFAGNWPRRVGPVAGLPVLAASASAHAPVPSSFVKRTLRRPHSRGAGPGAGARHPPAMSTPRPRGSRRSGASPAGHVHPPAEGWPGNSGASPAGNVHTPRRGAGAIHNHRGSSGDQVNERARWIGGRATWFPGAGARWGVLGRRCDPMRRVCQRARSAGPPPDRRPGSAGRLRARREVCRSTTERAVSSSGASGCPRGSAGVSALTPLGSGRLWGCVVRRSLRAD